MTYPFRTPMAERIFQQKYAHPGCETWEDLCSTLVHRVCDGLMEKSEIDALIQHMAHMRFIPGGRYLYYAGRPAAFFNNCFLLRAEEDTREDWANLSWKSESCLMTGGGIGIDYSVYRPHGAPLGRTGGVASGPLPKMFMINEIGRNVMQGSSRRSALYASLNWQHGDIKAFVKAKDWHHMEVAGTGMTITDLKLADFNYPAPLDMTNISVNYDDAWLGTFQRERDSTFRDNVRQAMMTGEPGFSFNFGAKQNETLRNACTEVTSEDDSDVCNLGSVNMSRIDDIQTFQEVCTLASKFLFCGTLKADLPYTKVYKVRDKNRRLGLGIMGVHEWLLQRGCQYGMTDDLYSWLWAYQTHSELGANALAWKLGINKPKGYRAVAPTGTIGILASTTTGIEPLFSVAYKRRYLKGTSWHYQYVVDGAAQEVIERYGMDPDKVESALDLAEDPERRIKFQADVQRFVDHSISSTLNLPSWDSPLNNEDTVDEMAKIISRYAPGLRGLTFYPDGARGGQPLTRVPYNEAVKQVGLEFQEHDICTISGKGGVCGI